jgi:hypothetical protein
MAKARKRAAESWQYVLKSDEGLPTEEQSRFTLRPLTLNEHAAYFDAIAGDDGSAKVWNSTVALCLTHITAIENFPAGEPREWPSDRKARLDYLEDLGLDACFEIGNEVYRRSKVEQAAKN